MTKVEVGSMEQINALMNEAAKKRSVDVTDMNLTLTLSLPLTLTLTLPYH